MTTTMTDPNKDFRVAIVGGGMCGLVCAIGLMRAGVHVKIFEQASSFREVGAGIAIGPNALFTLKELGVLEAVISKSDAKKPTMGGFRFISAFGSHDLIYDYPATPDDVGLGVYRNASSTSSPSFLEAIVPMLDSSIIHMQKRCDSVSTSSSGSHVLHFADGNTYEADLIIGADGIKSVLREFVSGQQTSPTYSNSVAYRSVLSPESLKNLKTDIMRPLCWVGEDKHIITYPVQSNQKINVVLFSTDYTVPVGSVNIPLPWAKPACQDELLHEYSGWGEDANIILKEMENPSKWYIHFLYPPLSSYYRQRIVLVGDAAHAMLPHLGSGVGQGFEDVYTLCSLLGDPRAQKYHLDDVLKAYDSVRVARANVVQKMSSIKGNIVDGRGPGGATFPQIKEQLRDIWDPIWHYDLKEEVKRAATSIYGQKGVL